MRQDQPPQNTTRTVCQIEHGKFKIILMDAPSDTNAAGYVKELKSFGVTDVVRTCEQTYKPDLFESAGIRVHEMTFADGAAPPDDTLESWNELILSRYTTASGSDAGVVAVHCLAGLGRATVLAAVALIEVTGIGPMDAVEKIRERQKGAINAKQLKFLMAYRRVTKSNNKCNCTTM